MIIPIEAIEAARNELLQTNLGGFDALIRRALEAAAPHMMASAWEEGESAGWVNCYADMDPSLPAETNPYEQDDAL